MSALPATIRPAVPGDETALLGLIRELAVYEKLEHVLVATEDDLTRVFFAEGAPAGALLAETESGEAVGYAIWFGNFSSFLARPGVYLEDVYVRPSHRGTGTGKRLLQAVARIALERDAGRMEWVVLDWNVGAIDFYRSIGGEILDEWRLVRMGEDAIEKFAAG